jgi:hypothetical protein
MIEADYRNHLILLTCTVAPNPATKVKRIDPGIRLEDYVESILSWAKLSEKLHFKIAVLENSNSVELIRSRIPERVRDTIDFFQLSEDLDVSNRGISYGEFKLLKEFADGNKDIFSYEYLWKVTGRLYVPNFRSLIPKESFDLVLNRFFSPRHLVDTRIIGFSSTTLLHLTQMNPDFYQSTSEDAFEIIRNSIKFASLEDFLTSFAHRCEMVGKKVIGMRKIPIFRGSSASSNKRLDKKVVQVGIRIGNLLRPVAIKTLRGSAP